MYTAVGTCSEPEIPELCRIVQRVYENAVCTRVLRMAW